MSVTEGAGLLETVAKIGAIQDLSQPLQIALFLGGFVLIPAALVCSR